MIRWLREPFRRALNARGFSQREKLYQVVAVALRQPVRVQRALLFSPETERLTDSSDSLIFTLDKLVSIH